jgi:hypothetical protein
MRCAAWAPKRASPWSKYIDRKVFLDLKVKVDPDWREDEEIETEEIRLLMDKVRRTR